MPAVLWTEGGSLLGLLGKEESRRKIHGSNALTAVPPNGDIKIFQYYLFHSMYVKSINKIQTENSHKNHVAPCVMLCSYRNAQ